MERQWIPVVWKLYGYNANEFVLSEASVNVPKANELNNLDGQRGCQSLSTHRAVNGVI